MAEEKLIFDLEKQLYADRGDAVRQKFIDQLETLRASLLAQRRKLSEREVFRKNQAALASVEGAIAVLHTLRKE